MTLSLPIVVGKKYVRRDGVIVTAQSGHPSIVDGEAFVGEPDAQTDASSNHVDMRTGRVWRNQEGPLDLVSDYIEPAKGHPHAALIMEFAKDAQESAMPWQDWQDRYIGSDGIPSPWCDVYEAPRWFAHREYRRRPIITPDPHAESAAEYAKDMAVSDKAWEGWEHSLTGSMHWMTLGKHPIWDAGTQYRRKGSL